MDIDGREYIRVSVWAKNHGLKKSRETYRYWHRIGKLPTIKAIENIVVYQMENGAIKEVHKKYGRGKALIFSGSIVPEVRYRGRPVGCKDKKKRALYTRAGK